MMLAWGISQLITMHQTSCLNLFELNFQPTTKQSFPGSPVGSKFTSKIHDTLEYHVRLAVLLATTASAYHLKNHEETFKIMKVDENVYGGESYHISTVDFSTKGTRKLHDLPF